MLWIPVAIVVIVLLFAIFHKRRDRWERPMPPRPRPAIRLDEIDHTDKD